MYIVHIYPYFCTSTCTTIFTQVPVPLLFNRYLHMMRIRQKVIDHARIRDIRYVFFVDSDNFLTNPDTLAVLIGRKKTIVGPMLVVKKDVAYSNYWAGTGIKEFVHV